jgi:ribosome-binding factor A
MSERIERVDELLRQELSTILTREIADPGLGFATITRVETARDLRHARVWVSLIGQREEREASLAALARAMPYIRRQLGARLRMRRIPEFHVREDESIERGARVLQILGELETGRTPDQGPDAPETLPTPARGPVVEPDEGDGDGPGGATPSIPIPPAPQARSPRAGRQRRGSRGSGTRR